MAGVSTATVSRVINNPELVADATAERVRRAMDELNYRPNIFAKGLITHSSRVLGIILPDFIGEFYTKLISSADKMAQENGYHVVVSSDARLGSGDALQSLPLNFLDGIVAMLTFPDPKLTRSLSSLNVPIVLIDSNDGISGVDRVRIDNTSGAVQATEHLLLSVDPGDCYYIGGPASNFDARSRADAFSSSILGRTDHLRPDQIRFGEYSAAWGVQWAMENLPSRVGKTTGIFAGDDEIALGIMNVASAKSIHVPNDLRIVGFDGTRMCEIVRPTLSSVAVPFDLIGRSAIHLCIQRIANPDRPSEIIPAETLLQVRESSTPA